MEHRSRCPIVDEVPRQPGEAELYGACIDGKPQRTLAADVSDGGERQSGEGCGAADGRSPAARKARDHGRGQGLRHARIRRRTAVDERTTRHAGYEVSQRKRKRVEQSFGWMKMVGMLRKVKLRGIEKVGWLFTFTGAAYNLCRLRNLMARA